MRIVVSQRDIILPPANFLHYGVERDWYRFLPQHQLFPVPNIPLEKPYYEDYECLLLTGGPDSYERNMTENLLFVHAVKKGVPIIGICHGAFVVNELSGGTNDYVEDHHDTVHNVLMDGKQHLVNSYHKQAIKNLGKKSVPLATDKTGRVEAFRHQDYPIYGIVWHPERMAEPVLPKEVQAILFP